MNKVVIRKTSASARKKYASALTRKSVSEFEFWKKIALEQQLLIHAKKEHKNVQKGDVWLIENITH